MHKSVNKEILFRYLQILGSCYATGDFSPLFPYLSDDCVWESQWRLIPETGKENVKNYFIKKGDILRETGNFPKWMIVEFIDNMNPIKNAKIKVQHEDKVGSVALFYEAGKLALFMSQDLEDYTNATIVDLTIDGQDKIKRIDLCMPELFKFVKYESKDDCLF